MNKQIWKYIIGPGKDPILMPEGAEILTVQTQNENACIWALVDPGAPKTERYFDTYSTGYEIPCDMGIDRKYIGTFQMESLVFHVFER